MNLENKKILFLWDEKNFEALFQSNYSDLCRFAFKFTSDQEISREIVQELFINLWQNKDSIKINSSIESYLYRAVRNRSINYVKRQGFLKVAHKDIADNSIVKYDHITNEINYKELQIAVKKGLEMLPDRCKEIFDLSRNGGLSCKEIASKLNLAPKTVENQLGIALKKLRERLVEYF